MSVSVMGVVAVVMTVSERCWRCWCWHWSWLLVLALRWVSALVVVEVSYVGCFVFVASSVGGGTFFPWRCWNFFPVVVLEVVGVEKYH